MHGSSIGACRGLYFGTQHVTTLKPRLILFRIHMSTTLPFMFISLFQIVYTFASGLSQWPYCSKRCTYCNFNKYTDKKADEERLVSALEREAAYLIQLSGSKTIRSVFFGGGTPSLAPPEAVSRILGSIRACADLSRDAEVTLEVNPTRDVIPKLGDFVAAGVTRLSVGVQCLDDAALAAFNRDHSAQDALRCVEECRRLRPGHVSTDLLFGRPGQTLASLAREITQMSPYLDDHVSLYQLTVERGTRLHRLVTAGLVEMPDQELVADMYDLIVEELARLGLQRYEVSNFAKPGAESRHNTGYWRGLQYIGVGPGAHGRFVVPSHGGGSYREARTQTLEPQPYLREVESRGHATRRAVRQGLADVQEELLVTSLRMTSGLDAEHWGMFSPQASLTDLFHPVCHDVDPDGDFILLDERGLRMTSRGLAALDSLLPHLLAHFRSSGVAVT